MKRAQRRSDAPRLGPEVERLLREVRPRLDHELRRFRVPGQDADDILQQTFLSLVYQWHRVRNPEAWLLGTVRNQCRLYWRRRRGKVHQVVDLAVVDTLAPAAETAQDRRDLWSDVEVGLSRLSERCQCLLRLRYQLGLDGGEIADRMGYSPHSVSKVVGRCLRALAQEVASLHGAAKDDSPG